VESNQIDILAFTVLRDLEQIDDTEEARLARQLRSDIRKTDRLDRIDLDLTFFHGVTGAHFDVGTRPYPDTASDFAATNSLAKPPGEHHEASLPGQPDGGVRRGPGSALRFDCGWQALSRIVMKRACAQLCIVAVMALPALA
jgi:hypothetical protein